MFSFQFGCNSLVPRTWYHFSRNRPAGAHLYNHGRTCVFFRGSFFKKSTRRRPPVQRRQGLCFLEVHFSKHRPAGGHLYNDGRTCVFRCSFFKKSTRRRQPVQRRQDLCFLRVPFFKKSTRRRQPVQRRQGLCKKGACFEKIKPPEATAHRRQGFCVK